jgi:hypothetical protein
VIIVVNAEEKHAWEIEFSWKISLLIIADDCIAFKELLKIAFHLDIKG